MNSMNKLWLGLKIIILDNGKKSNNYIHIRKLLLLIHIYLKKLRWQRNYNFLFSNIFLTVSTFDMYINVNVYISMFL